MILRLEHRTAAAALLAAALAGCANPDALRGAPGWDVAGTAAAPAPTDPLPAGLWDGYLALAAAERAEFDWRDAAAFLRKAQRAAAGETPPPFTLGDRRIGADALRAPLAEAEPQLLALLGAPGARLRAPRELARMQIDWECWLQEAEEGHQSTDIEACRAAFGRSLAAARAAAQLPAQFVVVLPERDGAIGGVELATAGGGALLLDRPFAAGSDRGAVAVVEDEVREVFGRALEARPLPPSFFTIHFDFGARRLDGQAEATVVEIVADIRRRPSPEVLLTGHADAPGDAAANLRLSRDRAVAVRDAIAAAMAAEPNPERAPSPRITTAFRGEAEPAAPAAAAEPRNRRVEITVR